MEGSGGWMEHQMRLIDSHAGIGLGGLVVRSCGGAPVGRRGERGRWWISWGACGLGQAPPSRLSMVSRHLRTAT